MEKEKIQEISAQAIVSEAEAVAKNLVETAARTASRMTENDEHKMTRSLSEALRQVFGENQDSGRFIDVTRIPLICQNINHIHENIKEITSTMKEDREKYVTVDQFAPYRKTLNIVGGSVILALTGAVIALVINQAN